jgi:hypothetical protein
MSALTKQMRAISAKEATPKKRSEGAVPRKAVHTVNFHREMVVHHKRKLRHCKEGSTVHTMHLNEMNAHARKADKLQSKYKASDWAEATK